MKIQTPMNLAMRAQTPGPKPQDPQPPQDKVELSPDVKEKWEQFKKNDNNRPPQLLGTDTNGNMHLGNVRWGFDETGTDHSQWKPRWKDVTINPDDVQEIFIGVEPFAPVNFGGGHGHAVIEFKHPVVNCDGEKDNRIVISLEAWTAPGDHYGAFKGLKKNFGVVYNVGSFSDRVQRQCRKEGRPLILHRLNLTQDQKVQFVRNSVEDAVKERTGEFYNTVTEFMFAAQVQELNEVLPVDKQMHRWTKLLKLPRMSTVLPGMAGLVLERYHLRTPDRPIEFYPDTRLFPDKGKKELSLLGKASQSSWWSSATRLGSAAAGAALGAQIGGWPGAVAGAMVTSYVGGIAADHIRILNGTVEEKPDAYYPDHVKKQL